MILYMLNSLIHEKGFWKSRPDFNALPQTDIHPIGSEAHILCTLYVELYIRREPFRRMRTAEQLWDRTEALSDILEKADYPHKGHGMHHEYEENNIIYWYEEQRENRRLERCARLFNHYQHLACEMSGLIIN
jgi:hypothetical protein